MKVYELIQKLCENNPNTEVLVRVDGRCDRFMEYIEDAQTGIPESEFHTKGEQYAEIWASIDAVHVTRGVDRVFIDCDLQRL